MVWNQRWLYLEEVTLGFQTLQSSFTCRSVNFYLSLPSWCESLVLCQSDSDGNVVILDVRVKHTVYTVGVFGICGSWTYICFFFIYSSLYTLIGLQWAETILIWWERRVGKSGQNSYKQMLFMGITSVLSTPAPPRWWIMTLFLSSPWKLLWDVVIGKLIPSLWCHILSHLTRFE